MVTAVVRKHYWNLERFGLTAPKLLRRILARGGPRVFCVCIPKSGTHLLERSLCVAPGLYRKLLPTVNEKNLARYGGFADLIVAIKPGEVVISHLYYDAERASALELSGIKCLFMIRDPRDLVVSQVHYIRRNPRHPLHAHFLPIEDFQQRLTFCIRGHEPTGLPGIGWRLRAFGGWLEGGALPVRFESLVGPCGGGNSRKQGAALAAIFDHLGQRLDARRIGELSRKTFYEASPTFRRGATGQWRETFTEETKAIFKEEAGDQLIRYGYEKDLSW